MIGDEEFVFGGTLEALGAVPGHVLDHEEGAVGDEDHVEGAVGDDGAGEAFDDAGEDGEARGGGSVGAVDEDVGGGAFFPVLFGGRVDGFLDRGPVEVDFGVGGQVVEGAWKAEDVPEEGAGSRDLVEVEAGVDEGDGVEDVVEEIAAFWVGAGGVG